MEGKKALLSVPAYGHVVASEKWRDSSLVQSLKGGGASVLFESEPGAADFLLPDDSRVLYLSESDVVVAGGAYERKLLSFRTARGSFRRLVLVENTRLVRRDFWAVQKSAALELGLSLLPVGGQTEASRLLLQMVHADGKENPLRRRRVRSGTLDAPVLGAVRQVPGVGRVKALALLERFPSIRQLCNADVAELEAAVGRAAAPSIRGFFRERRRRHDDDGGFEERGRAPDPGYEMRRSPDA
ncbi:Fanconi anemia core complex-associated protein 24 [Syngnathoides biaculeatus]|uniref:Fanconi anemia core complex-associated protein 24 n=1 Tax=Syngnathoides biaculeatus TaxID=300417 RepID=UPI002ADE3580|nr:Fanconi anemia core complex-associated protein 24 [Syngnathoides biaculeatus]